MLTVEIYKIRYIKIVYKKKKDFCFICEEFLNF